MGATLEAQGSVEIYGIYDADGCLKYIGKTKNAQKRFKSHLREHHRKTPFYNWLRKAVSEGKKPICKVLETCAEGQWQHAEKEHIFQARLRGELLLNLADGGDEPKQTREQRQQNARKTNAKRPRGYHRACVQLGHGIFQAVKNGNAALETKLRDTLAYLRAMTREEKQRFSERMLEARPSWQ